MRFCNVVWTAMVVGLLCGVLLLSGCGQKVAAPELFTVTTATGTTVTTRVSLYGTVLDQDGNPVQGASVTLGTERVMSGGDGLYTFTDLLPGTYYVSAYSEGYVVGGTAVLVSTLDVTAPDITLTKLDLLPNVEEVRGTEIVEVTEEGVTVGVKTIFSGEPPLGIPSEEVELAATLVLQSGVQIKDAAGNVVTKAPTIAVTYLERSQCPSPATGAFGMSADNVETRPGVKQTVTTEVVSAEGVRTELTMESPNELLTEGTVVRMSNVPLAGFVLEANGEQGGTFSEPQTLTIQPEQLTLPIDLIGSGLPPGTQIPFVDADGGIHYATLQEDGSIDLEVTKIGTYMMQTDFNVEVASSEMTATLLTSAAKPVTDGETESWVSFLFDTPNPNSWTDNDLTVLMGEIERALGLSSGDISSLRLRNTTVGVETSRSVLFTVEVYKDRDTPYFRSFSVTITLSATATEVTTGTVKLYHKVGEIGSSVEWLWGPELATWTQDQLVELQKIIRQALNLGADELKGFLKPNEQVAQSMTVIELDLQLVIGGQELATYHVKLVVKEGVIISIEVIVIRHESGKLIGG